MTSIPATADELIERIRSLGSFSSWSGSSVLTVSPARTPLSQLL